MNYNELQFYYTLYLNGIITNDEIYEIDMLINDQRKTITLPDFIEPKEDANKKTSFAKLVDIAKKSSSGLDDINNILYQKKNKDCSSCPFFKNSFVPIDGNVKSLDENVDVLIINLNPSLDDAKNKQIFKDTSVVRQNIQLFPQEVKWLLINLIPCAFKSKSEIGGKKEEVVQQIEKCSHVTEEIFNRFKPKFYILIGEEVFNYFYSTAKFADSVGQLIEEKFLPILHPVSMRQPKAQLRGKEAWANIVNILFSSIKSPIKSEEKKIDSKNNSAENVKTNNISTESKNSKDNWLLLDVREMSDGNVLIIYTDDEGNKHYEKKKNVQTSFLKNSNFKECDILTDNVDYEFNMTKMQKFKLSKLLRTKMNKLKGR